MLRRGPVLGHAPRQRLVFSGVGVSGAAPEGAGAFGSLGGGVAVVVQHGGYEGGERLLGAADLAVTEGGLFEGRDGDLGEALEVLDGVKAEADGIADIEGLDDAVEELREDLVERWLRDLKKKKFFLLFLLLRFGLFFLLGFFLLLRGWLWDRREKFNLCTLSRTFSAMKMTSFKKTE